MTPCVDDQGTISLPEKTVFLWLCRRKYPKYMWYSSYCANVSYSHGSKFRGRSRRSLTGVKSSFIRFFGGLRLSRRQPLRLQLAIFEILTVGIQHLCTLPYLKAACFEHNIQNLKTIPRVIELSWKSNLLDLVWAVSRGHVDDQMQLPSCVLHVLTLELLALGVVGPGQALVDVQRCVEGPGDHQEAPADRLKQEAPD